MSRTPKRPDTAGVHTPAETLGMDAGAGGNPASAHVMQTAGTDTSAPPQAGPVTVILLSNVDHDGERLAEGAEPTLPADVAARLVAAGAARIMD